MASLVRYLKRTRSALWGERPRHEEGAAIGGDSGVLLLLEKGTEASLISHRWAWRVAED
jgi:hypothetical protein